ncbi:MAG: DUF481 domain-containing protein, partial [Pseudomonadota bacterium]
TTDLGLAAKLQRDGGRWRQSGEFTADFGETDGEETKNRLFVSGQLDREFSERLFAYGRASHEIDEFSGFDSRSFFGLGAGYQAIKRDATSWSLQGGPGLKIDEIEEDVVNGVVVTPAETEESVAVRAASNFSHAFNPNVTFSNDTSAIYADVSTQVSNTTALTSSLFGNLSARVSFDVRYDTDPPAGTESTDTATRVSLVYPLGGGN